MPIASLVEETGLIPLMDSAGQDYVSGNLEEDALAMLALFRVAGVRDVLVPVLRQELGSLRRAPARFQRLKRSCPS